MGIQCLNRDVDSLDGRQSVIANMLIAKDVMSTFHWPLGESCPVVLWVDLLSPSSYTSA